MSVSGEGTPGGHRDDEELSPAGYRNVFLASPDGIVIVDREGVVREANPRVTEMFGYERDELLGREVEILVPESARSLHREERETYTDDPEPRPMGVGRELEGRRKDGSVFPVEISLSPVVTEAGPRIIATIRDLRRRERLREFGADALNAAEEERQRIARELHDDSAQRLAALLVRIRAEMNRLGDEGGSFLQELRSELLEITEGIRRIARGLRPPALEDAGLAAALHSHVRGVAETTDLDLDIDVDRVDPLLGQDTKLALYRIAQEALSNAVRHSGADRVVIRVRAGADRVVLEIADDGRGFEVREAPEAEGRGLGILGMYERAHGVGGELTIESGPGEGTRVRARLPAGRD